MNAANRKAFGDMLAWSEGTSTSLATVNDGYDVIVTGVDGPEIFTDYSTHPFVARKPKEVRPGLLSTASGRYQFMLHDFGYYRMMLDLGDKVKFPEGAFSPAAQEAWCEQLIRERGCLPLIDVGAIPLAIKRCSNLWASLPGNNYGQHQQQVQALLDAYTKAGGELV